MCWSMCQHATTHAAAATTPHHHQLLQLGKPARTGCLLLLLLLCNPWQPLQWPSFWFCLQPLPPALLLLIAASHSPMIPCHPSVYGNRSDLCPSCPCCPPSPPPFHPLHPIVYGKLL
jgi:hypothetical protein